MEGYNHKGYNHMDWILHNTKGHTPAGYRWYGNGSSPLGLDIKWCVTDARHDAEGWTQEIEANILLVKSAPLLLAEVKRLREVNDELQGDLEQFIERSAEDEAGLKDELEATEAEVKRLREQLRLAKEWVAKQYPCCLNTMDIFTEYIGDEEE